MLVSRENLLGLQDVPPPQIVRERLERAWRSEDHEAFKSVALDVEEYMDLLLREIKRLQALII
jgi:hypothetical protein